MACRRCLPPGAWVDKDVAAVCYIFNNQLPLKLQCAPSFHKKEHVTSLLVLLS